MWLALFICTHPPPDEPPLHELREVGAVRTPYPAWANAAAAHVRKTPGGADIGIIRKGDWVIVREHDNPTGWALLDPFGYVRLSQLRTGPAPDDAQATYQRYHYGTVLPKRVNVYAEPDERSEVLKHYPKKYVLAFRDDFGVDGWLQRPSRGWVRAADVRLAKASEFSGVHDPEGPLAFFVTNVGAIPRHAHRPASLDGDRVIVDGAPMPRSAVRLAVPRPRPRDVPPRQRWAHVDLKEQVLTVYEGDKWIFATLVSTGKGKNATKPGVYRVQQKVAHTSMDSERDRYFVDEVPFIQYFNGSQGFHAAFWHDHFGNPASHGCVNLAVDDAQWLFDWSNPKLPEGWQSITTHTANLASLWVVVR